MGLIGGQRVYAVHTTLVDNVGAMSAVYDSEAGARMYAQERSTDYGVLCAAVTSFVLNELGTRTPVGWYREGVLETETRWPHDRATGLGTTVRSLHEPPPRAM